MYPKKDGQDKLASVVGLNTKTVSGEMVIHLSIGWAWHRETLVDVRNAPSTPATMSKQQLSIYLYLFVL